MKNVFSSPNQQDMLRDDVSIEQRIVSSFEHPFHFISIVILVQLSAGLKNLASQNNDILHEINRCENDLQKYDEKLQILDNMTQLATQSLEVYFQTVGRKIFRRKIVLNGIVYSVWRIYVRLLVNNVE